MIPPTMPGYPPTGPMVPGYAPMPYGPRPPASVTTAAVLAYVSSGLMLLCGLLVGVAALAVDDLVAELDIPDADGLQAVFLIVALIPIALAIPTIVAARQLQKGSNRAFLITMSSIMGAFAALQLAITIPDALSRSDLASGFASIFLSLISFGLAVGPLLAASTASAGQWIDMHRGYPLR